MKMPNPLRAAEQLKRTAQQVANDPNQPDTVREAARRTAVFAQTEIERQKDTARRSQDTRRM